MKCKLAMTRTPWWCHSNRSILFLPVGASSSGPSACQNASAPTSPFISSCCASLSWNLIGSVASCWQRSALPSRAQGRGVFAEYRCSFTRPRGPEPNWWWLSRSHHYKFSHSRLLPVWMRAKTHGDTSLWRYNYIVKSAV